MKKVRAGIVGGAGYTGGELLRWLLRHPSLEVTLVTSESQAGEPYAAAHPGLPGYEGRRFQAYDPERLARECDFVFLAKPQPNSFAQVRALFGRVRLIDLSGDFRLGSPEKFERWYHEKHGAPEFLKEAVYGLPEFLAPELRAARLVANPGCYATGVLLALLPLLKAGLVEPEALVSAVSGFSGAGRTPSSTTTAYSVVDNLRPYKVVNHPHQGEILEVLSRLTGHPLDLEFIPQVAGFERGILEVIFCRFQPDLEPASTADVLEKAYRSAPFVRVHPAGRLPELKGVVNTNFCDLGWQPLKGGRLLLVAALDNLVKGAAGQAIQNLNLMAGLPETAGL
ncbi:MAG TPA: N-acetyl-gamma-glutamyl-phosphate reductase [bacterium]|uniref:N-acetyl-gamma-glutamyl-phosphate reductase n=1 Tax=candidate division TA06 bacterium ADurb.Bin417 TaxID=1852828 RepID=A0A1V5MH27_UNCT6|nr:MAG: N-acetyl-gamma-glutamyl-phosphate reductase [candidate division TA06 bacterium ADurb.Bin417]HNQ34699.1 N-acetyl-gamma-glutamyl-phosphate reductase [bacterium]HNS49196.1 N-acetyl-gamma-glutamyl-phosphate reductase [bacterium]